TAGDVGQVARAGGLVGEPGRVPHLLEHGVERDAACVRRALAEPPRLGFGVLAHRGGGGIGQAGHEVEDVRQRRLADGPAVLCGRFEWVHAHRLRGVHAVAGRPPDRPSAPARNPRSRTSSMWSTRPSRSIHGMCLPVTTKLVIPCTAAHRLVAIMTGSPGANAPASRHRWTAMTRWANAPVPIIRSSVQFSGTSAGLDRNRIRYGPGCSRPKRTYAFPRRRSDSTGSAEPAAASSSSRSNASNCFPHTPKR